MEPEMTDFDWRRVDVSPGDADRLLASPEGRTASRWAEN